MYSYAGIQSAGDDYYLEDNTEGLNNMAKQCVICRRGIDPNGLYTSYGSSKYGEPYDDSNETHICERCMDRLYAPISIEHWQSAKQIMAEETTGK